MDPTPPPAKPFDYRSEGEQVTDPIQIAALLKKVKDTRTLMQVTIAGQSAEYNSALLQIDAEHGFLLLDELTPPEGHHRLSEVRRLTASIRLRGVDLRFTTRLQQVGGQAGIAFYRVDFPLQLHYRQRRAYYRVKLGLGLMVPFSITHSAAKAVEGQIDDISVGGIGAQINQQLTFNRGDLLPGCTLLLPTGEKIDCEVEVRYISHDEQHRKTHLGARFVNMDRARQNTLKRFTAEAERELLRRKVKE